MVVLPQLPKMGDVCLSLKGGLLQAGVFVDGAAVDLKRSLKEDPRDPAPKQSA